jgi:hypothetical protein
MSLSETCKAAGLKNALEMAEITGESVQNLHNWYKSERYVRRFNLLLRAAVIEKTLNTLDRVAR